MALVGAALVVGCQAESPYGSTPAWRAADGMDGFFSPIPLPVDDIGDDACVERVVGEVEDEDEIYEINGEELVDLGIFHIHTDIEHEGIGDACEECEDVREGHIVLGTDACRLQELGKNHPTPKAEADALLLTCGKAVISFAVCLDAENDWQVSVNDLWDHVDDDARVCYNFGGPTGDHADHAGMVQWIHALDACEHLDPALVGKDWHPCFVKESATAEPVEPGEHGDVPLCGYVNDAGCDACGEAHQRCCDPTRASDTWYFDLIAMLFPLVVPIEIDGCNPFDGSTCTAGRCWPAPKHWPDEDEVDDTGDGDTGGGDTGGGMSSSSGDAGSTSTGDLDPCIDDVCPTIWDVHTRYPDVGPA